MLVKCLDECNRLRMKSVSVPSVGAGNLGYPPDVVAKCLLETSADYISKNQHRSLQIVHFVIFDKGVHQEFRKQYATLAFMQEHPRLLIATHNLLLLTRVTTNMMKVSHAISLCLITYASKS